MHTLAHRRVEQHVAMALAEESAALKEKRKGREEKHLARGSGTPLAVAATPDQRARGRGRGKR